MQLPFLTIAALLASTSNALGVNCGGSFFCRFGRANAISEINATVQSLSDTRTYPNGQHIACSGKICAFLQNVSENKTGAQVKGYVQDLLVHGCTKCGSYPTEVGNDVREGELTVDFV